MEGETGARTRDIQLGKKNDDMPSIQFYNTLTTRTKLKPVCKL